MEKVSTSFDGAIPANYDKYLGPLLFEFTAKDFAARVAKVVGEKGEVLEIAAGTGISTEYLRKALPESVSILATDISEPMLNFAKAHRGNLKNVSYEVADGTALSYADNRFDVVACQFGIMFFPDKKKALEGMMRVLKPGGTIIFNVWDSLEKNEVVKLAGETAAKFFPSDPPRFIHIPFGYNNIMEIEDLMKSAGLTEVDSDVVSTSVSGSSPENIARGFVTGNPMAAEIKKRASGTPEEVIAKLTTAIVERFGKEPVVKLQKIVFWGTKPATVENHISVTTAKEVVQEKLPNPLSVPELVGHKVSAETEAGSKPTLNRSSRAFIVGLVVGALLMALLG